MKLITLDDLPENTGVFFLEASLRNPGMNPVFYCSIESFHRQNPNREVFVLIPSVNQEFKARKAMLFFLEEQVLIFAMQTLNFLPCTKSRKPSALCPSRAVCLDTLS